MSYRCKLTRLGINLLLICSLCYVFCASNSAKESIQQALSLCLGPLLSALFPFLVLSNLLFVCDAHQLLGRWCSFPAKLIGVSSPGAGSALLMGCTGGFAPACVTLRRLYENQELSAQQCTALLPLCLSIGPSFVVLTVGGFFHSPFLGWILYLAQMMACLVCGMVYRFFTSRPLPIPSDSKSITRAPVPPTFSSSIADAALSFVKLSGCILFFSFLSGALQFFLPEALHAPLSLCMEVSSGCAYAAHQTPYGLYLCSIVLSFLGLSALIQIRSILPKAVSLRPFLLLRPLHAAISVFIVHTAMQYLPAEAVYSSVTPDIFLRQRSSPLAALILFLLLCRLAVCLADIMKWYSQKSLL